MTNYPCGASINTHSARRIPIALAPLPAGIATEADDDYEYLDINEFITKGKEGFLAYRVTGDSMVEQIQPGYIVFVDPYSEPQNGDIVAFRVNGRTNIKIYKRPNRKELYLISANKKYPPIEVTDKDDVFIVGVVKGHAARY